MKIQFSLPENGDFFNRYATLIPTLSKLGFIAQIISGITEVGIIYGLIYSRALEHSPTYASWIALLGALLGTAFLEIGLRKFTPYSVRAFLYRRFKGLDLAMTCFIFAINLGLLIASGALSFKGSKEIIEIAAPTPKETDTSKIDIDYQTKKVEVMNGFISDSTTLASNYQKQIEAKQDYFNSLIGVKQSKIKTYDRKEQRTGKSFTTMKETLRGQIQSLEADKSNTISELEKTRTDELKVLITERKTELQKAESNHLKKENTIQKNNQIEKEKAEKRTGKYGNLVAYFTLICLFIFVVSVALNEINKKGSGIEQIAIPNQYNFSQPIFSDFTNMIVDKWNYYLRTWIKNLAEKTPKPPLPSAPPILYNMGTVNQSKLNVEMEETETETIYLSHDIPIKKNRQQIGFKTQPSSRHTDTVSGKNEIPYSDKSDTKQAFSKSVGLRDKMKVSEHFESDKSDSKNTAEETVRLVSEMKSCEHCGTQFKPYPKHKRFCSTDCRKANWTLKNGRDPMMKKKR